MKKGQLTIFVLVGILVVIAIVGITFLLKGKNSSSTDSEYFKNEAVQKKVESIMGYAQDCMKSTTKEALIVVAFQGGYYKAPARSFSYSPVFFPYYYYEGEINLPSLEKIESELGSYVDDKMIDCIDEAEFANFKMDYEDPRTNVKIEKGNVNFVVNMPIEVSSEGNVMTIDLGESEINYNSSLYFLVQ